MKILVADDDPIVRTILHRIVKQCAHEVIEAQDGLDALGLIEREDPDVLLTDLRMPVLDGFELVAAVRSSPLHSEMPIVCLSAVSDRAAIASLAALGITDYVLKPIRPRDVGERLESVIERHGTWKLKRNSDNADRRALTALVIDSDANFRSFVVSALAPEFAVIEAATRSDGVALLRAQTAALVAVLVAEGSELLGEAQAVPLLRRLASDRGWRPPAVLLVSAGTVAPDRAALFDGVVRRTTVVEDFVAAVAPWLAKEAPCPTA